LRPRAMARMAAALLSISSRPSRDSPAIRKAPQVSRIAASAGQLRAPLGASCPARSTAERDPERRAVLATLEAERFQQCFVAWVAAVCDAPAR
jgi:hypothetical protein